MTRYRVVECIGNYFFAFFSKNLNKPENEYKFYFIG